MTLEELEKLIADDDGEAVEVKEATGQRRDARNKRVRPFRICFTVYAWRNVAGFRGRFRGSLRGRMRGS